MIIRVLIVCGVVIGAVAGCGGGDSDQPGAVDARSTSTPVKTLSAEELAAEAEENRLAEAEASAASEAAATRAAEEAAAAEAAAAAAAEAERLAEEARNAPIVLTGSGDSVVNLTKNATGAYLVHVVGNGEGRYFGVSTIGTEDSLVNTTDPYDGVRPLDWDGGETTGFEVQASGAWTIEVLPLSSAPAFDPSYEGTGDAVVQFTGGDGSIATITGNNEGRYFGVSAVGADSYESLVNTTDPYQGSRPISGGLLFFDVQASGPWTIAIS